MTEALRLAPRDWMTAPETRAVLAALTAEGAEVRFVGGCVRDALAGRPVRDIDLATPDPPERVMTLLDRAGLKAVPTGLDHGTVTAVSNHRPYEVTTLRHDVETHGRHATVAFTDDWQADAARRDFTFNAMSCRPDGTLFDPFGGAADLAAGRVRFVGEARARIEEDYLRLLRFFRFQAHYGRGAPDGEGLAAAAALAPGLTRLSGERLREELLRLLQAPDPVPVLEVMRKNSILASVLPQVGDNARLAALLAARLEASPPDALLRLAALFEGGAGEADTVAERLRLSKAERRRLSGMLEPASGIGVAADDQALRKAIYRLGQGRIADILRLDWAARCAAGDPVDEAAARRCLDMAAGWRPPDFPLKGRDALCLGMKSSEDVGRLLEEVESWWIGEDFRPSREDCLARLKQLIEKGL
ncbi:MAG: CCA tRNA nucleotidyltransferase [Rhodospirillales bacterium]|nr:CCA tRNA nucleotidyltransferase [Rhodospirillales bacterium]